MMDGKHLKHPVLIVYGYIWRYRIAKVGEYVCNKATVSECCCTRQVSDARLSNIALFTLYHHTTFEKLGGARCEAILALAV
jgi:hypothetical protein